MTSKYWPAAVIAAATILAGPALAEGLYGAIAFSPSTGQAGSGKNFDDKTAADTEAYLNCGAQDCETVVWFDKCGAIAVGDGFGMGFAADSSAGKSEDAALANCNGFTANCVVTASSCNDGF